MKSRTTMSTLMMAACGTLLLLGPALTGCRKQAPPTVIGHAPDAIEGGTVEATQNAQVARYTIQPQSAARVTVDFGPTMAYGLRTWTLDAPAGRPATILVAGMRGDTTYHMQAVAQFPDGTVVRDVDHAFTTGHYRSRMIPAITVQSPGTPQPGVEMINPSIGHWCEAIVTDLQGHVLWAYEYPDRQSSTVVQIHKDVHALYLTLVGWLHGHFGLSAWVPTPKQRRFGTIINPIIPLSNGDFLVVIGMPAHQLLDSPDGAPPPDTTILMREINLAGETIRQIDMQQLNDRLRATGYKGPTLEMMHHDVAVLPNGHMIVIAAATRDYTNLPGYPGTTRVIADVLVDLDPRWQPVWTWSEFDHLDVNRHPKDFPDWTHTNAVLYTKDDGNLIVSMRSQSWVIKIDYRNGQGTGKILWTLGKDGDLRLINGQAPQDWNYGQHNPALFSTQDAGVFDLGMMDNGYGRILADGRMCGTKGAAPCYTTVPIFRIDEAAKTATLVFRKVFPPKQYSYWGGGVQWLPNGNVEIDLCSQGDNSDVWEVTRTADPQTVWHMHVAGTNDYRTERLGSLYPGVQW
ncbi:MAG: aryl-sulfate sulfotransferase [Acidobacteriaceae bacterium]